MAHSIDVALRARVLARDGAAFTERIAGALGVPEAAVRLLSAPESFGIQEVGPRFLEAASIYLQMTHATVSPFFKAASMRCRAEKVIVFLGSHVELPFEIDASLAFSRWPKLFEIAPNLLSFAGADLQGSALIERGERSDLTLILRGDWARIGEPEESHSLSGHGA